MKKHFVRFYSPGVFFSEMTEQPIKSWNVAEAVKRVAAVKKQWTTPYGFCFVTRERGAKDLDSKITKTSGMYFLGGTIMTLDNVKARNNPEDHILISNMECNHFDMVIVTSSGKVTLPFSEEDVIIPYKVK